MSKLRMVFIMGAFFLAPFATAGSLRLSYLSHGQGILADQNRYVGCGVNAIPFRIQDCYPGNLLVTISVGDQSPPTYVADKELYEIASGDHEKEQRVCNSLKVSLGLRPFYQSRSFRACNGNGDLHEYAIVIRDGEQRIDYSGKLFSVGGFSKCVEEMDRSN